MVSEMRAEYFAPKEDVIQQKEEPTNFYILATGAVGIVLEMAKSLIFPLPLASVAHQQILTGLFTYLILSLGLFCTLNQYHFWLVHSLSAKSKTVKRIGFIGLGAMGFGMATHLLNQISLYMVMISLKIHGASKERRPRKSVHWKIVKVPKQKDGSQCGFYVMTYMKEIIMHGALDTVHSLDDVFKIKDYEKDINEMRTEWVETVQEFMYA